MRKSIGGTFYLCTEEKTHTHRSKKIRKGGGKTERHEGTWIPAYPGVTFGADGAPYKLRKASNAFPDPAEGGGGVTAAGEETLLERLAGGR